MSNRAKEWEEGGLLNLCEFVRRMSNERLEWLISDPALGLDILQHASDCEECGSRVENVVQRSFEDLPDEEKKLYEQLGNESSRRKSHAPSKWVDEIELSELSERVLKFAAADSKRGTDPEVTRFTLPTKEGGSVLFFEDAEGRLFAQLNTPERAALMRLSNKEISLGATVNPGIYELIGVGLVDISELVERTEENGHQLVVTVL